MKNDKENFQLSVRDAKQTLSKFRQIFVPERFVCVNIIARKALFARAEPRPYLLLAEREKC